MIENKKVIAIAEDDIISVEILHRKLNNQGYEVHIARDGRAGLNLITELKPDLAIVDMLLPRLHGLEVCRRVKRDPGLAQIPVLLVSGVYRDERSRREALRAGAEGFFTKPFDMKSIMTRINELLAVSRKDIAVPTPVKPETPGGFRGLLWGRLAEVEDLWARIRMSGADQERLESLQNRAHGLAGAGTVFGFPDMGKWAENLGRDLGELVEGSRRLDDEVIARITANLTQIRRAAIREYGSMHGGRELVEVVSPASEQPQEEDRPLLVYLIDKDMVFANELSIQLELFGYKVEVYAGMEDFERCERDIAPDAVVVAYDQNESALNEKRDHRLKHIPLIFIGPDEEVETRLSALRSGGDAFFTRPLRTENLLTCLDGLTSRRPMSSFRVLVVEDDRFMAEYICDALRQAGMIAKPVTEPMKIMKPLHDFNPDLILMDMYLPQCDGSELARLIRQESAYAGVPIVFLSGEKDPFKQEDIKGMGVDDFLTKPIKPELLVSSISHRVLRFRELRALMARDHLTGLFNYATVKEHFFTEVERAKRVKTPCTLGIIDLDSLGRINARHGHAGGDAAMRNLALILTQRLRGSDHIGCFEGAALLVVLTNTDGVRALQVMDEIRRDFHRINLTLGRTAFHASFSAGLASYPRFRKAKTMIEAAEQALQKAKKLGRNRVELAN